MRNTDDGSIAFKSSALKYYSSDEYPNLASITSELAKDRKMAAYG